VPAGFSIMRNEAEVLPKAGAESPITAVWQARSQLSRGARIDNVPRRRGLGRTRDKWLAALQPWRHPAGLKVVDCFSCASRADRALFETAQLPSARFKKL
jgi:hypothetical protein